MPEINLNEFEFEELLELSKRIEDEIERRHVEGVKQTLAQMKNLAASLGMTVEEVMKVDELQKTKAKGVPKYRNPDNPSQTWTGRGKKPKWFTDALERGHSVAELEI